MGSDRDARVDVLTGDGPDPREYPEDRKKPTEEATEETLTHELATVADRHSADLTDAEIVQILFDFADTWAMVEDVEMEVEHVEKPDGSPAAVVHLTGPRADDVLPSPVGKFYTDELEQMGGDDA